MNELPELEDLDDLEDPDADIDLTNLSDVAILLSVLLDEETDLKQRISDLKNVLRSAASAGETDRSEDGVSYVAAGDSDTAFSVSEVSQPTPPLLAGPLLDRVGLEVLRELTGKWLDTLSIPAKYFDEDRARQLMEEERLTTSDLSDSLGETPAPRAATVRLTSISKIEEFSNGTEVPAV